MVTFKINLCDVIYLYDADTIQKISKILSSLFCYMIVNDGNLNINIFLEDPKVTKCQI